MNKYNVYPTSGERSRTLLPKESADPQLARRAANLIALDAGVVPQHLLGIANFSDDKHRARHEARLAAIQEQADTGKIVVDDPNALAQRAYDLKPRYDTTRSA